MQFFFVCSSLSLLALFFPAFSSSVESIEALKESVYDITVRPYKGKVLEFRTNEPNGGVAVRIRILTKKELCQHHYSRCCMAYYQQKNVLGDFIAMSARFFRILRRSKGNVKGIFGEELRRLEWESHSLFSKHIPHQCRDRPTNEKVTDPGHVEIMQTIVPGACISIPLSELVMNVGEAFYFSPVKFLCIVFPPGIWRQEGIISQEFALRAQHLNRSGSIWAAAGPFVCLHPELISRILGLCSPADYLQLFKTCRLFFELLRGYSSVASWHLSMITQKYLFDAQPMIEEIASAGYPKRVQYYLLRNLRFVRPYDDADADRAKRLFMREGFPFYLGGLGDADFDELFELFQAVFSNSPPSYSFNFYDAKILVKSLESFIYRRCGDDESKTVSLVCRIMPFINKLLQFIANALGSETSMLENVLISLLDYLHNKGLPTTQCATKKRKYDMSKIIGQMQNGTLLQLPTEREHMAIDT